MIVTCESCNTSFELDDDLVSESGSEVKCSKCDHAFTVYKPASDGASGGPEEEPEETLDLDLSDLGEPEEGGAEEPEQTLDLDLSDIEEPGGAPEEETEQTLEPAQPQEEESSEADLDLGAFGVEEEPPSRPSSGQEEIDLDALSRALEEEIEETEEGEDRDEVLDFDLLDEEDQPEQVDLDLESIEAQKAPADEGLFGGEGASDEDLLEAAEEELEAELPDDISGATLDETELEERPGSQEPLEAEEEFKKEVAAAPPVTPKRPAPRRGVSTPVWIFVAVGLLAAGAFGAYGLLKSLNVKIPFLESLMGVEEEVTAVDPGNMHIALPGKDITSKFYNNKNLGRLFIIQGKVRNDYDAARNFIVVKATLYSKAGKEIQKKTVFCGNIASDKELQTMDQAAMDAKMKNKFGHERANFRVTPGKSIPFVAIFSEVPKNLGEFAVEVVSSLPGE